jgi:trans-aconitate methyltransferase
MVNESRVRDFYDDWQAELVLDFVHGNPRACAAIRFTIDSLRRLSPIVVVDVGCGIGWSSAEIVRSLPGVRVHAVDLSPNLVHVGRTLFQDSRLTFGDEDVTKPGWRERAGLPSSIDAFVLLDVYEHIPSEARPDFHAALGESLSPTGSVILTCPSRMHQAYLRECHPSGLQPVDEDLSLEEVLRFAEDLSAEVMHFQYVSIWKTNDYFHALITRKPRYQVREAAVGPTALMPLATRRAIARRALTVLGDVGRRRLESGMALSLAQRLSRRLRRIVRGS